MAPKLHLIDYESENPIILRNDGTFDFFNMIKKLSEDEIRTELFLNKIIDIYNIDKSKKYLIVVRIAENKIKIQEKLKERLKINIGVLNFNKPNLNYNNEDIVLTSLCVYDLYQTSKLNFMYTFNTFCILDYVGAFGIIDNFVENFNIPELIYMRDINKPFKHKNLDMIRYKNYDLI